MTDQAPLASTLRALANSAERMLGDRLQSVGITVPQLEFLTFIAANPGCCGADAAEAAHVSPATGTTVLNNLVAKRLIETEPAYKGHRNSIAITEAGVEVIAQAQCAVVKVEKRLAAALGAQAVRKLPNAVEALQPHLPPRAWRRNGKTAAASSNKSIR